jgi:UMF1 family MFS transporter
MVAIFPIYFIEIARTSLPASGATQALATANTIAALIVAVASPILGAISDYAAVKKRMLAGAMAVGVLAVAGMFFLHHGDDMLALVLFVLSLVGATVSVVMYESLLPHIARASELDRVSSAGYALGYLGGGILLAVNVLWILEPQWFGLPAGGGLSESQATLPTRLALLSVAVWWVVFAIPLFRKVPEPPRLIERDETASGSLLVIPFVRLGETLRSLRGFRHAFLMLLAFMVYNDGIQTIQKMATAYGTELGISRTVLITAILLVQFMGFPFAFLFGALASRIGAKHAIFLGLLVYAAISVLGYFMRTAMHFMILATLVATVQGGTQALSRSLFASLIPAHKSGEFFGFYSVFEKFASILGPLLFAVTIALTGSSRSAILSVIVFFIVGTALLARVDVAEGQRAAGAADLGTREAPRAAGVQ